MKKLNSAAGASITFALLLFLVCAVLCTVILTAATAASGRMSRAAENDQRYYAVTSAAELLRGLVGGRTVSIVEVETTPCSTVYTGGVAGTPVLGSPSAKTYLVADKKAGEIAETDLTEDKEADVLTVDSILLDAANRLRQGLPALKSRELTLTSAFYEAAELDYDALSVTVLEELDGEGNLRLTLYNRWGSEGKLSTPGERCTMILDFAAERDTAESTRTEHLSTQWVDESEDSYTEKTRIVKMTVTTLTWNLTGIRIND